MRDDAGTLEHVSPRTIAESGVWLAPSATMSVPVSRVGPPKPPAPEVDAPPVPDSTGAPPAPELDWQQGKTAPAVMEAKMPGSKFRIGSLLAVSPPSVPQGIARIDGRSVDQAKILAMIDSQGPVAEPSSHGRARLLVAEDAALS